MIDPIDSLTFSLHANKGAYALLLGSGVSRAARIPTGWEVVEDLIRRLAVIRREECEPDPATWYERVFGRQPTYSGLLEALARSTLERQQLLRGYFEPNEQEREQGLKTPTQAHRSAAALVSSGHVRIILTTNFDRLTERALEEIGIVPTVASTADQIQGLPPLLQIPCLVLKLHGDYLDSRIKNTPEELERYDKRLNRLLDRILDEFGIIVCGWSAQWDRALCAAIERCRSHRFTTYWAHKGTMGPEAARLVTLRRAQAIPIDDADTFFESLATRLEALEEYDRPHPLSVRMTVETIKNYIVDPRHRIRLSDLVSDETEDAYKKLFSADNFPLSGIPFNGQNLIQRMRAYESIIEKIQAAMITGAAWGEPPQVAVWQIPLKRINGLHQSTMAYLRDWKNLESYPVLRLMYASGMAAIANNRYDNLFALMETPVNIAEAQRQVSLQTVIIATKILDREALNSTLGQNFHLPSSVYLARSLRETLQDLLPSDNSYNYAFDLLEYLWALTYVDKENHGWCPPGRFAYFSSDFPGKIHQEIEGQGADWPPLKAGFFGGSLERLHAAENAVSNVKPKFHFW